MEQNVKEWAYLIQTVGFPILACCWLLWRTDSRLEKLTDGIAALILELKRDK